MKQKQRKRWLSLLAALLLLPALAACGPGAHIPTEEPPEL